MEGQQLTAEFSSRDLRRLVIPLVIEQLLAILVGMCDSVMVSQVGEAAISAVSLVDSVNVLLINAFSALATGGAVVAGQYLGRQAVEKARHSGEQLMLFMAETSLAIMVLFYFGKGFILNVVFGHIEPDVAAYANTYFLIVEASIPFLALYNAGAALFRVMGISRVSMWVSLLMNAINVTGNAILIFGVGMGVEGVAIPTLVSRAVAAVVILLLLRHKDLPLQVERIPLHHDRQVVRNIFHFGVPNGLENSMFQLGKILLLSTVSALGTASVAPNAISNTVSAFQIVPGTAMGLAIVTVVSRCMGAGSVEKARHYTKKLMLSAYLYTAGASLLLYLLLPLILWLYNVSPEAQGYVKQILLYNTIFNIVLWPTAFSLPQTLRAAGDTRFTLVVSSISMWTMRVGLGILLCSVFHLGVVGVWLAMYVDWCLRALLFVIRFLGHKWETMGLSD